MSENIAERVTRLFGSSLFMRSTAVGRTSPRERKSRGGINRGEEKSSHVRARHLHTPSRKEPGLNA